jgi:hypothetical protein
MTEKTRDSALRIQNSECWSLDARERASASERAEAERGSRSPASDGERGAGGTQSPGK